MARPAGSFSPMPTITLKQAPELMEKLGPRMRQAAIAGCLSAAMRGMQIIVTQIIPSRTPEPVDRRTYAAGWRAYSIPTGGVIENLEPHAPIIEDGARAENIKPGRAMLDALAEWVVRKGIAPQEEARGVAWAIARAMQRRGIFGRGMKVLAELVERHLPKILEEEIAHEIERAGISD
jgi:hypothetical protein